MKEEIQNIEAKKFPEIQVFMFYTFNKKVNKLKLLK